MRQGLLALSLSLLLGCAGSGAPPPNQLQFFDSQIFDDQLHDTLAFDHDTVLIAFMGTDVTVNRLPERLDKWFYVMTDRYDCKIQMVPDPNHVTGRGLEGLAITLAIGAYNFATERLYYRPIKDYDATVYFVPDSGVLTRIVFRRRAES